MSLATTECVASPYQLCQLFNAFPSSREPDAALRLLHGAGGSLVRAHGQGGFCKGNILSGQISVWTE